MTSIGFATLQIIPSLRGMEKAVQEQLGGLTPAATRQGSQAGQGFLGRFGSAVSGGIGRLASDVGATLTSGLAAAGAAGAGLFAAAMWKGWDRFTTIEDATAALTVQLGDAGAAAGFLDDILGVVRGTPFNLDQFARAGAQLVGFGVSTEKIPGYLTAIGEASATQGQRAGEFADRLSTVFGQVAAAGRLSLADVWRISDTGVNALAILANHFDVTTDAMRDMISSGTVPAGEALDALAKGIVEGSDGVAGATVAFGGTMEGLRETLTGARGGFGAALARFGAGIITPFSTALTTGFVAATDVIDKLGEAAGRAAGWLAESAPFRKGMEWFTSLPGRLSGFDFSGLRDLAPALAPIAGAFAGLASTNLAAALGPLGRIIPTFTPLVGALAGLVAVSPELREALGSLIGTVVELGQGLATSLAPVLSDLVPIIGEVAGVLVGALGDALGVVAGALVDALPALAPALVSIAESIGQVFVAAAPAIPLLAELAAILMTSIGVPVITAIAGALAIIADGLSSMGPVFPVVVGGFVALKVAFAALTAVMAINPFVLVATAIAAMVVGLVWAYQNVEWFRNAIQAVGRAVAGFVSWVASNWPKLLAILTGPFGLAVLAITRNWDRIVDFFKSLPGIIAGAVSAIPQAFGAVVGFFAELPGRIISALADFGALLLDVFVTAITNIPEAIGFAIGALVAAVVGIPALILTGLWELGNWLWDEWLYPAITALPGLLGTAITATITFFRDLPGKILDAAASLGGRLLSWAREAVGKITEGAGNALGAVLGWFRELPGKIVDAAKALPGLLYDLARKALDIYVGFVKGLVIGLVGVISWMRDVPGKIVGALGSLKDILLDAGKQIMTGLLNGLNSGWTSVRNWMGNRANDLKNLITAPLRIFSPSRVFMGIGDDIMAGLLGGLEDGWGDVERFMAGRGLEIQGSFAPSAIAPTPGVAYGGAGATVIHVQADRYTDGTRVGREIDGELRRLRGRSG